MEEGIYETAPGKTSEEIAAELFPDSSVTESLFGGVAGLVWLGLLVVFVVSAWKVFSKAGRPGWASLVPVYNTLVMLWMAGKPWWWLLLFMIPFVNIIMLVLWSLDFAKAFGKGPVFAILGLLLTPIGYLMLAFDKSTYTKPSGA